ncbi:HPr kinase/phosphorylase [Salinarimonas soli]|uniref:Serine/threonine protein kinase n=1 Tax=Salinarimonas soli TaxID=1638099 RepID=A0A5B2VFI3_9HYPH|nr:serine/threonine protein kinase [Salinarimonas soli]KAA2237881.1 serine/threonine protein kinase [Salinarimonas soli]
MSATTIHAGCVVIGEAGVLIRGPSGSGKSALARRLVEIARGRGAFARPVADDRVRLERRHDRLLARPVPAIAGLQEIRGWGIVAAEHEGAAIVRLVVDCLTEPPERLPAPEGRRTSLEGLILPRVAGLAGDPLAALALARLAGRDDAIETR